jgi:hypothetical protein
MRKLREADSGDAGLEGDGPCIGRETGGKKGGAALSG